MTSRSSLQSQLSGLEQVVRSRSIDFWSRRVWERLCRCTDAGERAQVLERVPEPLRSEFSRWIVWE